jgi:hypothetical protein
VTGPGGWPPLRRRPASLGRHRALPTVTETPLPPKVAASLPLHSTAPEPARPPAAPPVPAGPELGLPQVPDVQCGWCKVIGPLSQIPGDHGWYRCADVARCTQRRLESDLPSELPPAGLEPLPQPEGADDAAELAATEALARWAPGEKLSKGELWLSPECLGDRCEDCPHALECVCVHHERDAARAADALAEHLGPDEQGFGEPEPAPATAETEPEDGES